LVRAITSENFELVEILVTKGSDIYQEDLYGTGLLIHSALYGDHRALKFLLSKGLDPKPTPARWTHRAPSLYLPSGNPKDKASSG
jgi:ankyrin repeat protein